MDCHQLVAFLSGSLLLLLSVAGSRYTNERVYEDMSAINFADALKNGFRIILADQFIATHLRPSSLPTIFVSAIPVRGTGRVSKILFPDSVKDDKMVQVDCAPRLAGDDSSAFR